MNRKSPKSPKQIRASAAAAIHEAAGIVAPVSHSSRLRIMAVSWILADRLHRLTGTSPRQLLHQAHDKASEMEP